MRVKIYSNEHNLWWRDSFCGYTKDESKAGIFEIEEVNKKYPYIDFDKTKEDYLVKFESLTYEELEEENSKLKKVIDFLKLNFDISLDSKLRISDGNECVQTFIIHLPENTTIDEMFEIIPEVLENEKD